VLASRCLAGSCYDCNRQGSNEFMQRADVRATVVIWDTATAELNTKVRLMTSRNCTALLARRLALLRPLLYAAHNQHPSTPRHKGDCWTAVAALQKQQCMRVALPWKPWRGCSSWQSLRCRHLSCLCSLLGRMLRALALLRLAVFKCLRFSRSLGCCDRSPCRYGVMPNFYYVMTGFRFSKIE